MRDRLPQSCGLGTDKSLSVSMDEDKGNAPNAPYADERGKVVEIRQEAR